jgi:glycosyltransferase involved in cell wall biosynthesis
MISILIPVYNYDVTSLVNDLIGSADIALIPYQIIVMDDYSNQEYRELNADLGQIMNVNYIELSENIGRSKIRNKLAKIARYEKLIFLDCDSELVDDQFILRYVSVLDSPIVYGGRIYQSQKPATEYMLHWKYGNEVEALPLSERIKYPLMSFLTNNFMCDVKIFDKFRFNESITVYGYEDLAFAYSLTKEEIIIGHIDNPVIHVGLDKYDSFLSKQKNAIESLRFLHSKSLIPQTKLIKTYNLIKKLSLTNVLEIMILKSESKFFKNLMSDEPKIFFLQLLKLNWFHQTIKNKDS